MPLASFLKYEIDGEGIDLMAINNAEEQNL